MLLSVGCVSSSIRATDVRMLDYHAHESLVSVKEFTRRLYAKNPKYEPDKSRQRRKLAFLAADKNELVPFGEDSSSELLTAAFAMETEYQDRVYLLGLGLVKSIREAYGMDERSLFLSAIQVDLNRLERLHHNLSQVNWRLKTYRDKEGNLIFLTNAAGEDGYLNMGYEVIMTEMLTRVKDDIYLRGGLPGKYLFNMSTLFMSIIL